MCVNCFTISSKGQSGWRSSTGFDAWQMVLESLHKKLLSPLSFCQRRKEKGENVTILTFKFKRIILVQLLFQTQFVSTSNQIQMFTSIQELQNLINFHKSAIQWDKYWDRNSEGFITFYSIQILITLNCFMSCVFLRN